MNKTYTDVVLNMQNFPFLTLTESKMSNCWYHETIDFCFCLTKGGFIMQPKSSKKKLKELNLL